MQLKLELQTVKKGNLSILDYLQKIKTLTDSQAAAIQPSPNLILAFTFLMVYPLHMTLLSPQSQPDPMTSPLTTFMPCFKIKNWSQLIRTTFLYSRALSQCN